MYTTICSSILFPLHERFKHHDSVRLRRELELSQWWDPKRLAALQANRLRSFISKAARDVPYYKSLFRDAGVDPSTVRSLDDLRRVPFLTKELIRRNTEGLKSATAGPLVRYNTGGSSGDPLVFFIGRDRISHDVAAKWRATRWWNVDIGDTEVVLWGSPIELGRQDRIKALRDRLLRTFLFPAFQMSEQQMDRYLDRLVGLRPKMLFGYASALTLLARHAEARGRQMDGLSPEVAFTTGETLYPDQRSTIERVFGTRVANGYGARDAGFIAHECPGGALHLSAEHIVVELIDEAGNAATPGMPGEVVVTHLATGEFPFVRYRTGDVATLAIEPCACGRGLPALQEVAGRSTDFIRTANGGAMHGLALIYEVRGKSGIREFKFVQSEDLSVDLLIVAGPEFNDSIEAEVRRGLTARLGEDTALRINRVAAIAAEKSGKFRYVVSHAKGVAAAPNSSARFVP